MEFVIVGKTEKSKDEIKKIIQKMGGKLGTKIHDKIAAIISTESEVERLGNRMQEAKDLGIQVVPEQFLDDAKLGNAISFIISQSLCDWGTDVCFFSLHFKFKLLFLCVCVLFSNSKRGMKTIYVNFVGLFFFDIILATCTHSAG